MKKTLDHKNKKKLSKTISTNKEIFVSIAAILAIVIIVALVKSVAHNEQNKIVRIEKNQKSEPMRGKAYSCSERKYCFDKEYIVTVFKDCSYQKNKCLNGCDEINNRCK